jgi:hypothetical protein
VTLNYFRGFRGLNFQTGNNKVKLLMEYENIIQKVLFFKVIKFLELRFYIQLAV